MSAKGSDIKAGAAFVELYVKDEKLKTGLKNAQTALKSFGQTLTLIGGFMAAMGAAILGPLAAAVHSFTEFGSQLNDISERTGVATTSLAELAHAAQQTGTSMEDVEKALKFMAKNGLNPNQFDEIAERIAAIQDPTERAQKAMEAWGKAGTMLLPLAANLKELRAEARALGIVFTDNQVKLADDLGDAFDRIKTAVTAAAFQVGAALAPALITLADLVTKVVVGAGWIARTFPIATTIVAALGVAFVAAGTALLAFGAIAAIVIPTVTSMIALLDVVAAPWILIGVAIAIVVTELVALAAIVTAITAYFLFFTDTGKKVLDTVLKPIYAILKRFEGLGSAIQKSMGLIVKALMAGDIKTAWKAMVLGMEAIWHGFIEGIFNSLAAFVQFISDLDPTGDVFGIQKAAKGALLGAADDRRLRREALEKEIKGLKIKGFLQDKDDPANPNYGLPERSAKAIGFNARSALMGRNIIGAGRDEKMLDTMTKILLENAASKKELQEIKKKIGPTFR